MTFFVLMTGMALSRDFNVKEFGAKGDGCAKDTAAIQSAVDAAARAGGGRVVLDAGVYLSGSLFLKSNVELHLEGGARILASSTPSDYNKPDICPQNELITNRESENTNGGHLILAIEQKNVSITGPGAIDGNALTILRDKSGRRYRNRSLVPWRPAQMVWFVDCEDVRVVDIELAWSPYWTLLFFNCERVFVRGCYIHTGRRNVWTGEQPDDSPAINGDGIDVDRCQYVMISDCRIDTEDDSITLRASCERSLRNPKDCAYVTVANCILSSSANAVRCGVGEGTVRDAVFSNLVIKDSFYALNFFSAYSPSERGTDIYNLRFENILVDAVRFMHANAGHSKTCSIHDIRLKDISGTVRKESLMVGKSECPLGSFYFDSVEIDTTVRVSGAPELRFSGRNGIRVHEDESSSMRKENE